MQTADATSPLRPLRVLLLEDRANDAELIVEELRRAGFEPDWQRIETASEFNALLEPRLDIILADYVLPQFDGLTALRELQRRQLDIPFILISGALGDERAVECIKAGVTDYLLKDRLERLGLAVSNALEERRLRAEARRIEEQLRQAQKMEAIGLLAGGIAHDFNNVLTVINGRTSLLLDDSALAPVTRESLTEIYTAGERAASLTRQLLLFGRKRPPQRVLLDLNDVAEEVGQMLGRLIGEAIELTLDLAPDLPAIEGDGGMLEQVLINLAVNARDAMPRGGQLTISTSVTQPVSTDGQGRAAGPAHICLRVTDTGTGIPPENLPRIFEPFFTTKNVGEGTGLGLATLFAVVKEHQGWVDVQSNVGTGTAFQIFLPVAAPRRNAAEIRGPAESAPPGGRETILVVEDETSVREFAVAVLQPAGYRVLQARSGPDALEVWKWHRSRIDLLLTDLVMPDGMSGFDLANQLQADKPSLPVVFTSGYSDELAADVFGARKGSHFIHKPYHPRALARLVRQALDPAKATTATN